MRVMGQKECTTELLLPVLRQYTRISLMDTVKARNSELRIIGFLADVRSRYLLNTKR
jgi:hypothetical protein